MPTHSKGNSVTKSISLPLDLDKAVRDRIESLGIRTFSEYARKLLEKDLADQGAIIYEPKKTKMRP